MFEYYDRNRSRTHVPSQKKNVAVRANISLGVLKLRHFYRYIIYYGIKRENIIDRLFLLHMMMIWQLCLIYSIAAEFAVATTRRKSGFP